MKVNVLDDSIITHRFGASTYLCVLQSSKYDNKVYVLCYYAYIYFIQQHRVGSCTVILPMWAKIWFDLMALLCGKLAMTLPWGGGLETGPLVYRGEKMRRGISHKETALFTEKNNYCASNSSEEHHFNIQIGHSEAQGCHFLLKYFEESLVLIQRKWQHWRPESLISWKKQVISLHVLITLASTSVFYPYIFILGREQHFTFRGDKSISFPFTRLLSASN